MTEARMPDGEDSAGIVKISVSDIDHRPPMEQPYAMPAATGPQFRRHARTNISSPTSARPPRIRHAFLRPSLSEKKPLTMVTTPLTSG